ncbi:MAG: hypothetical protein MI725_05685 [Pirellulales bacterium]|nr:hypothetical protein [Pirellulales bacterium]
MNRESVVWALEELASREEQERLWLSDGSSGEVSSFTEAICGVFDDGGVSRALDSNQLPNELATRFRDLSKYVDKIPQNAHPQEQIDHPAMKEIVRLSQELMELLLIE